VAKLKQVNVRPDADTLALLERVKRSASEGLGIRLSLTAIFRLALLELDRKYPSGATADVPTPAERPTNRKKG
jgi:hypothetical protein